MGGQKKGLLGRITSVRGIFGEIELFEEVIEVGITGQYNETDFWFVNVGPMIEHERWLLPVFIY